MTATWRDNALCAETDPDAFFPEPGGSSAPAKAICSRCEVSADCLDYALANAERFGVWGGMSERERYRLRRPVVAKSTAAQRKRRARVAELRAAGVDAVAIAEIVGTTDRTVHRDVAALGGAA